MANLIGVLFFTLFSSLSFAESHCLQRKNEPTRLLRVGLGESHTKVLPLDVQGVMASVSVEDHYPELKSAMESGEVDVVAAVFPQGQGSALVITARADFEARSLAGKVKVDIYSNYHDIAQTLELPFEVEPTLVLTFGYDESAGKVVWNTPEAIKLPTHEKGVVVCFEMLTVPPRDYRVHVQGAGGILPHQPGNWVLTEPGPEVGTYSHEVTTKDTVTVEYREHYTEGNQDLRKLTFNSDLSQ